MFEQRLNIQNKVVLFIMIVLIMISSHAWGAAGTLTLISPPELSEPVKTNFTVSGTYISTEDGTPTSYPIIGGNQVGPVYFDNPLCASGKALEYPPDSVTLHTENCAK